MRRYLAALTGAVAVVSLAASSAAQNAPAPKPKLRYQDNFGVARSFQLSLDRAQRQIERLDDHTPLGHRESTQLRYDGRDLQRQFRGAARDGLTWFERASLNRRLDRLEQRIRREERDRERHGRATPR